MKKNYTGVEKEHLWVKRTHVDEKGTPG